MEEPSKFHLGRSSRLRIGPSRVLVLLRKSPSLPPGEPRRRWGTSGGESRALSVRRFAVRGKCRCPNARAGRRTQPDVLDRVLVLQEGEISKAQQRVMMTPSADVGGVEGGHAARVRSRASTFALTLRGRATFRERHTRWNETLISARQLAARSRPERIPVCLLTRSTCEVFCHNR